MLTNNNQYKLIKEDDNMAIQFNNKNTFINLKSRYRDQNNSINTSMLNSSLEINQNQLYEPFDVIEFYTHDESGIRSKNNYVSLTKLDSYKIDGKILLKHIDSGIIIEFDEKIFTGHNPILEIYSNNQKKTFELYRKEKNLLSSKIINISEFENIEKINIVYDTEPNLVFEKKINGFITDKKNNFFYKKINIDFDSDSFIQPTFVWIEKSNISTNEYETIIEPFVINPITVPLKKGINISSNYKSCLDCSFYKYNESTKKWKLINSIINDGNINANIKYSGTYALLKENILPIIRNLKPAINSSYNAKNIREISFNLNDELSGINPYKIDIWLNNEKLFYDYIPYRNFVTSQIYQKLIPGKQELKIQVYDKLDNKKTIQGEFIVIEK